ncbi:hypothetical protein [Ktedonosporobacter rubrisoli]|uniref:hypothetical protein n=1 Tax=Ktedonosporobacter rubrisoli TaxID=2509675 RepID=UPI001A925A2C|nr:hypothetical protein [Ktedonosporobacter rubrisoli]
MPVEDTVITVSFMEYPEQEKRAWRASMLAAISSLRSYLKSSLRWLGDAISMSSFLMSCSQLRALQLSTSVLSCCTVYYTAPVAATPSRSEHEVIALSATLPYLVEAAEQISCGKDDFLLAYRLPKRTELVIVDEAQRLKMAALEQIRDPNDRETLA